MADENNYTQEQLDFIKKKNLKIDKNGIAQVPSIALMNGYGKLLKKNGIKYDCYDCVKVQNDTNIIDISIVGTIDIGPTFNPYIMEELNEFYGDAISVISNNEIEVADRKDYVYVIRYIERIKERITINGIKDKLTQLEKTDKEEK